MPSSMQRHLGKRGENMEVVMGIPATPHEKRRFSWEKPWQIHGKITTSTINGMFF
jgi:hypothetical protein